MALSVGKAREDDKKEARTCRRVWKQEIMQCLLENVNNSSY